MDNSSTCQAGQHVHCPTLRDFGRFAMAGRTKSQLPKSMSPKVVAARIIAVREALGLTPTKMADELRVDRSSWSKYESGKRPMPADVAYRAAERFDLTMDYFFRGRLDGLPDELKRTLLRRMDAA